METIRGKSKTRLKSLLRELLKHIDDKDEWKVDFEREIICAIDANYFGGKVLRNMATGYYRLNLSWQKQPKKARKKRAVVD
jgi:hypothetical protein